MKNSGIRQYPAYLITIFITMKMVSFFPFTSFAQVDTLKIEPKDTVKKDIYKKLESSASKNIVTQKMYGLFFRKSDLESAGRIIEGTEAIEKFRNFAGKKISKIEIVKLDAFGYSVYDSTIKPSRWIENVPNKIHLNTSNYIIKNNLLFELNDKVNPVDLTESEQLLRNLPFIEDVNIQVYMATDTSMVNVKVIVKDAWSIAAGLEMSSATSGEFHIYEKNLGGLGVGLNAYLYNDSKKPDQWGKKGELLVPNILGSFVRGEFGLHQGMGYDAYYLTVKRDFYASKAKNAWGFRMVTGDEPYSYKTIDSIQPINYSLYDYWIGRSFRVSRKNYLKAPYNFVISARHLTKKYYNRPEVSPSTNYYFHNKNYYLASLSLSQQTLFNENLIYSFGKTEDIPTGFKVQVTSGYEVSEYRKRIYLSNELSASEHGDWGYLFLSTRSGTFFAEGGNMEQAVLNIRSTFFTRLFSVGKNELRQFVKVDYTRGFQRFAGEGDTILLGNNNGIRGLSSKSMKGTSRLTINLETVEFSNIYLYGFRLAYFIYADMGFIGSSNSLIGNDFYSGFGIGVRIRNENLVFRTFLIRLGYYPNIAPNSTVNWWSINGEQKTYFETFRSKEPQILQYE